jgi:hypothetical protein
MFGWDLIVRGCLCCLGKLWTSKIFFVWQFLSIKKSGTRWGLGSDGEVSQDEGHCKSISKEFVPENVSFVTALEY